MDSDLAHLSTENEALYFYNVTQVEQLFKKIIIEAFIFSGTNIIAGNIKLNSAAAVLELTKGGLTHSPAAHQPSCQAHIFQARFSILKLRMNFLRLVSNRPAFGGKGIYSAPNDFLQGLSPE